MNFTQIGKWTFNLDQITFIERHPGTNGIAIHFSGSSEVAILSRTEADLLFLVIDRKSPVLRTMAKERAQED